MEYGYDDEDLLSRRNRYGRRKRRNRREMELKAGDEEIQRISKEEVRKKKKKK